MLMQKWDPMVHVLLRKCKTSQQETAFLILVPIWENLGENPNWPDARQRRVTMRSVRWDYGETKYPTKKEIIVNGGGRELGKQKELANAVCFQKWYCWS